MLNHEFFQKKKNNFFYLVGIIILVGIGIIIYLLWKNNSKPSISKSAPYPTQFPQKSPLPNPSQFKPEEGDYEYGYFSSEKGNIIKYINLKRFY
ncbi:MAG: hypothetical protein GBAus27B_000018 [Mycoplasmataceae bacterium]|nr:MAG: hypothetical protein GBAus27B_000018 [Mycoplasmataceae bacterium]